MGPAASRMGSFAKYFSSRNVEVEVLTCNPRYPRGFSFEDLSRMRGTYTTHGAKVNVFPVPVARFSAIQRFSEELLFYTRGMKLLPRLGRPDLIIGTSPFFSAACLGFRLSRKLRVPFIYDIRDLYPENLRIAGIPVPNFLYNYFQGWAKGMYAGAARLVVNQPSLLKALSEIGRDTKAELVMNPVEVPNIIQKAKRTANHKKMLVGYAGAWGRGYDFATYLDVIRKAEPTKYTFRIFGSGIWQKALEALVNEKRSNFDLHHGWLGRESLIKEYSEWDISLVPVDKAWTKTLWPSKIPELLAFGIIVIVPPELPMIPLFERIPTLVRAPSSTCEGYLEALEKAREIALSSPQSIFAQVREQIIEELSPQHLGEMYLEIILEAIEYFRANVPDVDKLDSSSMRVLNEKSTK